MILIVFHNQSKRELEKLNYFWKQAQLRVKINQQC